LDHLLFAVATAIISVVDTEGTISKWSLLWLLVDVMSSVSAGGVWARARY
jgi:hypothetical protein